jgi:hypothetical protein
MVRDIFDATFCSNRGATMLSIRTMFASVVLLAGSAIQAAPVHAQVTIKCESQSNRFKSCTVNTNGRARLQQNLSSTRCEYGRTWGFDWSNVWVDRGCRGLFQVAGNGGSGWQNGNFGQRVTCESQNGSFKICQANTWGDVRMVRQLSQSPCVPGRTWGYQADQIWVGNGCRAEFELGYGGGNGGGWNNGNRIVTCESNDGNYSRCHVRNNGRVSIRRQLSQTTCRQGQNWGVDANGIWVNNGCRAEFQVGANDPSAWMGYPGTWGGGNGGGAGNGGGNGGGSVAERGRQACLNEARSRGYQNPTTKSTNQNNNVLNVGMQGFRSSRQYSFSCVYTINNNQARLSNEQPAGGGGNGGGMPDSQLFGAANSACQGEAKKRGYTVNGTGPTDRQNYGARVQMALAQGQARYPSASCAYNMNSRIASVSPGTPAPQPR